DSAPHAVTIAAVTFTLAVASSDSSTGTGTISSGDSSITCGATCANDFAAGRTVTLTAAADSGSSFVEWSGDCSGTTSTCDVTMDSAKNVSALFASASSSVTSSDAGTGGTVSTGGDATPTAPVQ